MLYILYHLYISQLIFDEPIHWTVQYVLSKVMINFQEAYNNMWKVVYYEIYYTLI